MERVSFRFPSLTLMGNSADLAESSVLTDQSTCPYLSSTEAAPSSPTRPFSMTGARRRRRRRRRSRTAVSGARIRGVWTCGGCGGVWLCWDGGGGVFGG